MNCKFTGMLDGGRRIGYNKNRNRTTSSEGDHSHASGRTTGRLLPDLITLTDEDGKEFSFEVIDAAITTTSATWRWCPMPRIPRSS